VTADRLRDFDEVVVVVGELGMPRVLRRVLHDNTADAIVEAVGHRAGASTIRVPVRVEPLTRKTHSPRTLRTS
jgi:hypothetical protein